MGCYFVSFEQKSNIDPGTARHGRIVHEASGRDEDWFGGEPTFQGRHFCSTIATRKVFTTKWVPTILKSGYNSTYCGYITRVIYPFIIGPFVGVITPLITNKSGPTL